jgi:predicted transcriptional regulator
MDLLKDLNGVFNKLVLKATFEKDEVKQTKTEMQDCKIPATIDSRVIDIKHYVENLGLIERDFEASKK